MEQFKPPLTFFSTRRNSCTIFTWARWILHL